MNTVNRTYQVRGKEVRLQELPDLVAVQSKAPKQLQTLAVDDLEEIAPQAMLPQVRAFEDAGWEFVSREKSAEGARVYLKQSGRVVLGTDRLTVRINANRNADEAEEFLVRNGFQVVDRLKLAPNLFVVQIPDGDDPIEAAKRLSAAPEVVFAEPELIEAMSGR